MPYTPNKRCSESMALALLRTNHLFKGCWRASCLVLLMWLSLVVFGIHHFLEWNTPNKIHSSGVSIKPEGFSPPYSGRPGWLCPPTPASLGSATSFHRTASARQSTKVGLHEMAGHVTPLLLPEVPSLDCTKQPSGHPFFGSPTCAQRSLSRPPRKECRRAAASGEPLATPHAQSHLRAASLWGHGVLVLGTTSG